MIKRKEEQSIERREHICDGIGSAQVRNLFEPNEMNGVRLFNHVTLEPGATFGVHTHHDETEFYYILKGTLETGEQSGRYELHPGDVSCTGDGCFHDLKNIGDEPAELLTVIVGNGSVTLGTCE